MSVDVATNAGLGEAKAHPILKGVYEELLTRVVGEDLLSPDEIRPSHVIFENIPENAETAAVILQVQKLLNVSPEQHQRAVISLGLSVESFDSKIHHQAVLESYKHVLQNILEQHAISEEEQLTLLRFRLSNGLTEDDHTRTLTALHWSLTEWESFATGESRTVVKEYSEWIRRIMAMPTVSSDTNDVFEKFAKDRGISEGEHLRALELVDILPEQFDAHRVTALRSKLRRQKEEEIFLDQHVAELELSLSRYGDKLASTADTARNLERSRDKALAELSITEEKLQITRDSAREIENRMVKARDILRSKEEAMSEIAGETIMMERLVEEEAAQLAAWQKRIGSLGAKMLDQSKEAASLETRAEHASAVVDAVGAADPLPGNMGRTLSRRTSRNFFAPTPTASGTSTLASVSEPAHDWGMNVFLPNSARQSTEDGSRKPRVTDQSGTGTVIADEDRKMRLFRTACLAVTASLVKPEDNMHVDVEAMYRTVQKDRIGVEKWNAFITDTIREQKRRKKEQTDKAARITADLNVHVAK